MEKTTENEKKEHGTAQNDRVRKKERPDVDELERSVYPTLVVHFAIRLLLLLVRLFCQQIRACGLKTVNVLCKCDFICSLCILLSKSRFFSHLIHLFTFSLSLFRSLFAHYEKKAFNNEIFIVVVDEHD